MLHKWNLNENDNVMKVAQLKTDDPLEFRGRQNKDDGLTNALTAAQTGAHHT